MKVVLLILAVLVVAHGGKHNPQRHPNHHSAHPGQGTPRPGVGLGSHSIIGVGPSSRHGQIGSNPNGPQRLGRPGATQATQESNPTGSSPSQGFIPTGVSPGQGFVPTGSSTGQGFVSASPSLGQGFIPPSSSPDEQEFGPSPTGPVPGEQGFGSGPVSEDFLIKASNTGIMTFENHACIFRNGEFRVIGPILEVGQNGDYEILAGTATLTTGETVVLDGGLLNERILDITDTQELQNSLARAGITLNQFIELTGTIPPGQGIRDVTAGVISINGVLKNIRAGVLVVVAVEVVGPIRGGEQPSVDPAISMPVTRTVTETAAHETETVFEQVTLTKTQTVDEFVEVTSPIYNSIAATITNLVKQTLTVPEEQVIRSPVAGSIIVNTIPVPSRTVLTISVRNTNMFVQTLTDEVTNAQTHFSTNYAISTATVNNPTTLTVIQTITQTRVSTVYKTSTIGNTVYTTITTIVNIGNAGGTATAPGGYY